MCAPLCFPLKAAIKHLTENLSVPSQEKGVSEPNYLVVNFAPKINETAKLSFTRCPGTDRKLRDQNFISIPLGHDLKQETCLREESGEQL